jgi:hypothetical protein
MMTKPTSGGATGGDAGVPHASFEIESTPGSQVAGGQGTGEGAGEQIREAKDRVVDQARSTLREVKGRASSSLSEGRMRAADQAKHIATAFHRTGQHLRDEDQARIAGFAESVARQVEQVASYLRDADTRAMARDMKRLTRRQPAVILGCAFAVGLIGARFLKSSNPDEDGDNYGRYDRIRAGGEPAGIGGGGGYDRL